MGFSLSTVGLGLKDYIRPDTACQPLCDDPRTLPKRLRDVLGKTRNKSKAYEKENGLACVSGPVLLTGEGCLSTLP